MIKRKGRPSNIKEKKKKKKKVRWLVIEPGDFFRSVVRFNLWRTRSQADQIEIVKNNNLETCMKDLGLNGGIHGP